MIAQKDLQGITGKKNICASCRKKDGAPYKFYFSKKLHEEKYGKITRTTYIRPITNHLPICDLCVAKERIRWILTGVSLILPIAIFQIYLTKFKVLDGIWLFSLLIALLGLGYLISALLPKKKNEIGSSAAIRLAKPLLGKDGFNKFWDHDPWKNGQLID